MPPLLCGQTGTWACPRRKTRREEREEYTHRYIEREIKQNSDTAMHTKVQGRETGLGAAVRCLLYRGTWPPNHQTWRTRTPPSACSYPGGPTHHIIPYHTTPHIISYHNTHHTSLPQTTSYHIIPYHSHNHHRDHIMQCRNQTEPYSAVL